MICLSNLKLVRYAGSVSLGDQTYNRNPRAKSLAIKDDRWYFLYRLN